jgi:peptide chain release factor 1
LQGQVLRGIFAFKVPVSLCVRLLSKFRTLTSAASTQEGVPPALLARARKIASEHKELTEKLANGFDTRAAKKLGEHKGIVEALKNWEKAKEVSCLLSL